MRKTSKKIANKTVWQKLSLYFFNRPRKTAILCMFLVVFGALSYSILQKREGFPAISTPFALSQGTYLVNDSSKVDEEVAAPLSDFLLKQDGVKDVLVQSFDNFYSAQVAFNSDVNSEKLSPELEKVVKDQKIIPESATIKLEAFKFGFTERGDDIVVSFYADKPVDQETLIQKAQEASNFIASKNLPLVQTVSIIDPFETAKNLETGVEERTQRSFERFGIRENDQTNFYNAVVIGIETVKGSDNIELDAQVRTALDDLTKNPQFAGYKAVISASPAPQIKQQISELQQTLLEGLLAVLIVGSLIIAIRASILTVISMVTVIAIVNGILYFIGYSLNTITLFGLILGLSLIVDDTIIMVEALENQKHRQKTAVQAVSVATKRISRAMIAATLTASLSFVPLLFVTGILGSFIRAIPVTIISALLVSLVTALVFIPFFARKLLFSDKQMAKRSEYVPSAKLEAKIAEFIAKPMLWAQHSRKKLAGVIFLAFFVGTAFIGVGGWLFQKVTFNIFPAAKDANQISVNITYNPNTNIEQAQDIAKDVEKIATDVVGENNTTSAYFGLANVQSATLTMDLKDYKDRETKSPELVNKLKERYQEFNSAIVSARQVDAGPPGAAFTARIDTSKDREAAVKLGNDLASYLETLKLKRPDGSIAVIESVSRPNTSLYTRSDGNEYLAINAQYVDTDTTTLVTLTQREVEKEFDADRLQAYGLGKEALSFNFGQESENQESFKNLALAFPAVLAAIFLLLAFQFKSLLQPLLIFMAIPFSLFGITLGLYLTDNSFSFFAMLGFFALIGLSIKNTILLTDYANQARMAGKNPVDAAHEALAERFRPLVATSLTAVVSLIPLAITSPFWEGLTVVLIFGLLSSTFLVITVFPYYYLAAEFLRTKTTPLTKGKTGNKKKIFYAINVFANVLIIGLLVMILVQIGRFVQRFFQDRQFRKRVISLIVVYVVGSVILIILATLASLLVINISN